MGRHLHRRVPGGKFHRVGSLLNWQPHIHALVTDGGFRPDGTFVRLPAHSTAVLTEAFRRGVLKLFVERELFEPEVAEGMLE